MPETAAINPLESRGLRLFGMKNGQVTHKKDISFVGHTVSVAGTMAMARYGGTGHIVVCGTDGYLYAYNAATNALLWKSDAAVGNVQSTMVGIADFNNDSIPEVYSGNRIFSLVTGKLLCDGGSSNNMGKLPGSGEGYASMAADIIGDGQLELCAGTHVYRVSIPRGATSAAGCGMALISDMCLQNIPAFADADGATLAADIDGDGKLEVVVASLAAGRVTLYVWKPLPVDNSRLLGSFTAPAVNASNYGIPVIGSIDDGPYPEIVFMTDGAPANIYALQYNPSAPAGNRIAVKWTLPRGNVTGSGGMSLFDFKQQGVNQIVCRDRDTLHIIDGRNAAVLTSIAHTGTATFRELPVIADTDGDGHAEIILPGWDGVLNTVGGVAASDQNGYMRVYRGGFAWAPARSVWNQYVYTAVSVCEDVSIPAYRFDPAIVFPGMDGVLGTFDDARPYNGCLMQQTKLDSLGVPLWPTPNVVADTEGSSSARNGSTVQLTVAIVNRGDAAITPPVHITLYKESVAPANRMLTDSAFVQINPGDTAFITVTIADIIPFQPVFRIIARVNDNGGLFPEQPECSMFGNEITFHNPALDLLMKKDAVLNGIVGNGTYPNPHSVLFSEHIEYAITAFNADSHAGKITITDTLPAYLNYVENSAVPSVGFTQTATKEAPVRDILAWTLNVESMNYATVTFKATPEAGVCASQPLFINSAWIQLNDTLNIQTGNRTYHQGAGVSIVTFSARTGGALYNATPQAVDYRSTLNNRLLIVPDEGYVFAGWSHDDYISLRGETVPAQSGIMHCDTLAIYGSVELVAHFAPASAEGPAAEVPNETPVSDDKIWSSGNTLHIKAATPGSHIRIYSLSGALVKESADTETIPLSKGIYIVTINNGRGRMVIIE
jgi:uncharacterized repeat protein (TIGR01451 family)